VGTGVPAGGVPAVGVPVADGSGVAVEEGVALAEGVGVALSVDELARGVGLDEGVKDATGAWGASGVIPGKLPVSSGLTTTHGVAMVASTMVTVMPSSSDFEDPPQQAPEARANTASIKNRAAT
jgi:hypothetical protein